MNDESVKSAASSRMKILFICGAGTVSGREIATLNLIDGLRERGHQVRCVASTWGDGRMAERLKAKGIAHISLPLGFISKTLSWSALWMTLDQLRRVPRLWSGFRRYVREFQPDVVVQSNFHHVFLLWPLLNSRRTFFHVHDDFPNTDFYRRLFRFLNRRLCSFVCVSHHIARSIARLGIPAEKVCSVYNGINVDELREGNGEASTSVAQRQESSGEAVIGIVGQVGEWKGHDDLIEALAKLRDARLSFSCIIYGNGEPPYIAALTAKIAACNLSGRVRHAGFVKHPKDIYAAMDICVVPSRVNEAFGMVAAEAAHFGVPVVATRLGGLAEIVQNGETGFLVDAKSPQMLAEKLGLLIRDAALRRKMGAAARVRASQLFTQTRMAQQMEDAFLQATNSRVSAGKVIENVT